MVKEKFFVYSSVTMFLKKIDVTNTKTVLLQNIAKLGIHLNALQNRFGEIRSC